MERIAVYPGSFDPVTNGHLEIIQRAAKIFDKVIVAVLENPLKTHLFTNNERVEMLKEVTLGIEGIEIDSFAGLLTHYMKTKGAKVIIKGLRAVSDFEYEFQMATLNKKLDPEVETLLMMTNMYSYLSSSAVKQVALFGGCIEGLVPDPIVPIIFKKVRENGGVK